MWVPPTPLATDQAERAVGRASSWARRLQLLGVKPLRKPSCRSALGVTLLPEEETSRARRIVEVLRPRRGDRLRMGWLREARVLREGVANNVSRLLGNGAGLHDVALL